LSSGEILFQAKIAAFIGSVSESRVQVNHKRSKFSRTADVAPLSNSARAASLSSTRWSQSRWNIRK